MSTILLMLVTIFATFPVFGEETVDSGIRRTVSAPQINFLCETQKLKSNLARVGKRVEKFNWNLLSNKDLVVLGDEHSWSDTNSIKVVAAKLAIDKENSRKCVFLEFSSALSIEAFETILNLTHTDANANRYVSYYKKIYEDFLANGYTPYLIDHMDHFTADQPLNERDRAMAINILSLHGIADPRKQKCDFSILIVGKAHWSPDTEKRTTIQDRIQNKINLTSIQMLMSKNQTGDFSMNGWDNLCPAEGFTPRRPVIFRNSALTGVPIYPNYSDSMVYSDFDYTLLHPQ